MEDSKSDPGWVKEFNQDTIALKPLQRENA